MALSTSVMHLQQPPPRIQPPNSGYPTSHPQSQRHLLLAPRHGEVEFRPTQHLLMGTRGAPPSEGPAAKITVRQTTPNLHGSLSRCQNDAACCFPHSPSTHFFFLFFCVAPGVRFIVFLFAPGHPSGGEMVTAPSRLASGREIANASSRLASSSPLGMISAPLAPHMDK
jgi:hypothetical protein